MEKHTWHSARSCLLEVMESRKAQSHGENTLKVFSLAFFLFIITTPFFGRFFFLSLLVGTLDENLDGLTLLDLLERRLRIFKVDDARDEPLDVDLALGDEVDGEGVVAGAVPEGALGGDLLHAQLHDGESDVGLAHAALDVGAAHADDVKARLDGGLGAAGVDDDVGAAGQAGGVAQGRGVLLGGEALGEVGVGGGEAGGEVELGLDDVDADDLGGAVGAGDGGAEEADGAGAHDDDAVAGLDVGLLGDVDGDGEGLDHGALLERDVVGELVAEVGRGAPQAGKGAVDRGRGGEAHLRAEVVVAGAAVVAAAAGVSGLEGDAVTGLKVVDVGADLDDGAGGLVAEDHGLAQDKGADGAVEPVVDVGAADAGVVHGDEDIVGGLEGGLGDLGVADILGLVEEEGEVLGQVSDGFVVGGPGGDGRLTLSSSLLRVCVAIVKVDLPR